MSKNENVVNMELYSFCTSFPKKLNCEVFRDSLLHQISNSFNDERLSIVIEGPSSTGKTILLSQFARTYNEHAFSFFIGEDCWSSSGSSFLQDMCDQLRHLPSNIVNGKFDGVDVSIMQEEQLISLFNTLYRSLRTAAKEGQGPFYFVIDGLHNIPASFEGDSLVRYFPKGDPAGIYILFSDRTKGGRKFPYTKWPIQYFSKEETAKFLESITKDESTLNKIYQISQHGMPGYLSELRRQVLAGVPIQTVVENPPLNIVNLMESEWDRLNFSLKHIETVLALLAFSPQPLNILRVCQITAIDQDEIRQIIDSVPFVTENSEKILEMGMYRDFVAEKLFENKMKARQQLISFYEKTQNSTESITHLPILYRDSNNFEALSSLVRPNILVQNLVKAHQTSLIRRDLKILADMAYEKHEWQTLAMAAQADSIFFEIITSSSVLEEEIKALLAIDRYDTALNLALSCILPEDTLKCVSRVCQYMKKKDLPLLDSAIKAIEDAIDLLDHTVRLTPKIVEGLFDICIGLFEIKTGLGLDLLKKLSEYSGASSDENDLMEILYAQLAMKLGTKTETINGIKSQITNEILREVADTPPSIMSEKNAEELIEAVKQVKDISAQLFFLQAWCNNNYGNEEVLLAIDYGLLIMTEREGYTPTVIHLHSLAKPLLSLDKIDEIKKVVKKIDQLKESALKHPVEQLARLELTLAEIELKWDAEIAKLRLFKVYLDLDQNYELDSTSCILAWILCSLEVLVPDDNAIKIEVYDRFIHESNKLFESSADQVPLLKKIIVPLTKYDVRLAWEVARKANIQDRRDNVCQELLREYTDFPTEQIDFELVFRILDSISSVLLREWVFIQILAQLSDKKTELSESDKRRFFNTASQISVLQGQGYSYAYLMSMFSNDQEKLSDLYKKIEVILDKIHPIWDGVSVGYQLVGIVSETNKLFAEKLFEKTCSRRTQSPFCDERVSLIYLQISRMLIRILKEMVKTSDFENKLSIVRNVINNLPAVEHQCALLSVLGLECKKSEHQAMFEELARDCLALLDQPLDSITKYRMITVAAPTIYEYERNLLFDKLTDLPNEVKNNIIDGLINYLLTGRSPDEFLNLKNMLPKLDYPRALKICEVIEYISEDCTLTRAIEMLVKSLVEAGYDGKTKAILPEKQGLQLVEKLVSIIEKKLPDKQNIIHDGYLIVCYGYLAKLIGAMRNAWHLKSDKWKHLCPDWETLLKRAQNIKNDADRVYVMSVIGKEAAQVDLGLGETILSKAEKELEKLSNPLDRVDRFCDMAEAYESFNANSAEYLIKKAAEIAALCRHYDGREQMMGKIVEQAYLINPMLANSIASKSENPVESAMMKTDLDCLALRTEPSKINEYDTKSLNRLIGNSLEKILASFNSGRLMVQHSDVTGEWLYRAMGKELSTVDSALAWHIDNNIASRQRLSTQSDFEKLFAGLIETIQMTMKLGELLSQTTAIGPSTSMFSSSVDCKVFVFRVGEGEKALNFIKEWLRKFSNGLIKIYDPYFSEQELKILTAINHQTRVIIMTSSTCRELVGIEQRYKRHWLSICDQLPSATNVYVYATASGRSPIHDRYIITDSGGLSLGTSINGFGSKDSGISILDFDEKSKVEKESIDRLLCNPPLIFKDESLTFKTFSL